MLRRLVYLGDFFNFLVEDHVGPWRLRLKLESKIENFRVCRSIEFYGCLVENEIVLDSLNFHSLLILRLGIIGLCGNLPWVAMYACTMVGVELLVCVHLIQLLL